mmetsp:Transcript_81529/g.148912  ORF Transcript_81529/g.148912 Transcript_81529/m.148912 type:complete len:84 (-) Transcript_81529:22-273(-)
MLSYGLDKHGWPELIEDSLAIPVEVGISVCRGDKCCRMRCKRCDCVLTKYCGARCAAQGWIRCEDARVWILDFLISCKHLLLV